MTPFMKQKTFQEQITGIWRPSDDWMHTHTQKARKAETLIFPPIKKNVFEGNCRAGIPLEDAVSSLPSPETSENKIPFHPKSHTRHRLRKPYRSLRTPCTVGQTFSRLLLGTEIRLKRCLFNENNEEVCWEVNLPENKCKSYTLRSYKSLPRKNAYRQLKPAQLLRALKPMHWA